MAKSFKRIMNMERAVRLEATGMRDAEIAAQLNLTPAGLAMVKQDSDYTAIRTRIRTGVVSELDEQLKDDLNYQHEKIRSMMPAALDGIFALAVQTKNERVRLAACCEIADRDGRLAKVSRIGLPTEDQGGIGSVDEEAADALIKALSSVKTAGPTTINSVSPTTKVQ